MPAPVSITAPNSPKKRGGKTSYGGSRPSPSGGHTAPAQSTPTVTTVSPSGGIVSSGPGASHAVVRAERSQKRVKRLQHKALKLSKPDRVDTARHLLASLVKDKPAPQPTLAKPVAAPTSKPATFLGKQTVGTPTLKSLQKSLTKGSLLLTANQKAWTTPQVRKVSRQLKQAAPADIPGFSPSQEKNLRTVVETGKKMGATRKELLAAVETGLVEAPYFHNPSGGDADSEGWRQERTSIYGTGPTGPTNVRASAKRFFQESVSDTGGARGAGQTAGELAQTIQGSAFPARYDATKAQAVPLLKAATKSTIPPKVVAKAKALGLDKQLSQKFGLGPTTGKPPKQVVTRFKAIVKAADHLDKEHLPYVLGGGHVAGDAPEGTPLDCSSTVSYVLQHAGIDIPTITSGDFPQYLKPGPGAVTVYSNSEHVFMRIGNRYFGTSHSNPSGGAGWIPTSYEQAEAESGKYTVSHVPGLGAKTALQLSVSPAPGMTTSGNTATIAPGAGVVLDSPGVSSSPIKFKPNSKPSGQEILAKLKKYGVGTDSTTASTTSDSTLTELEKRYGVGV